VKIEGSCWKFGDHVNTDEIIPARYLNTIDEKTLAAHCMEGTDPEFPKKVRPGDVIVAGENFGCGSSREHAPIAIKGAGVSCVIARSFARIFLRNCINIGLPIVESPEAADAIQQGHTVAVDLRAGIIRDETTGRMFNVPSFPDEIQQIIQAGGLMNFVRAKLRGA